MTKTKDKEVRLTPMQSAVIRQMQISGYSMIQLDTCYMVGNVGLSEKSAKFLIDSGLIQKDRDKTCTLTTYTLTALGRSIEI